MAAPVFRQFDSTPANLVTDLRTNILAQTDWAQIGATTSLLGVTTTRGAQIRIDLSDAAPNNTNAQFGIYRTHDGTTGVDKLIRYLRWKQNAGASTEPLHVDTCAWKEGLFIGIEGPKGGEANADDATWGSYKQSIAIVDIIPYFGGDTVPAVCLVAHIGNSQGDKTTVCHVSRNQGNVASWVPARLASLQTPCDPGNSPFTGALQPVAKGDGNYYLWPYVVVESYDGLRGRLNNLFFAGFDYPQAQTAAPEPNPQAGTYVTYGGNTYRLTCAEKGLNGNNYGYNPLGAPMSQSSTSQYSGPIIALPTG